MSEKNREGKRAARESLMRARAAEEVRGRRRRKLAVTGAVLAVVAVAGAVGVVVQNQRSKPDTPLAAPSGALGDQKLLIPSGAANAPAVLTVYEDPRCPACGGFERDFAPTVDQLEDQGKLVVQYHIVSFIDRSLNGKGSRIGANALACAQDAGHFRDYHDVLYRNQPDETSDAFSDRATLIKLSKQVPGLDTPAFESCVKSYKYGGWVAAGQQNFDKSGYKSTPTLLLNGTPIYPKKGDQVISTTNLVTWVAQADQGKPLGTTGSHGQRPAPTTTAKETNTPPSS